MAWEKEWELLALMVADGFELFVTVDQNLSYQQNIQNLPITIVVLCGNDTLRQTLRLLLPKMFAKLTEEPSKRFIEIS